MSERNEVPPGWIVWQCQDEWFADNCAAPDDPPGHRSREAAVRYAWDAWCARVIGKRVPTLQSWKCGTAEISIGHVFWCRYAAGDFSVCLHKEGYDGGEEYGYARTDPDQAARIFCALVLAEELAR